MLEKRFERPIPLLRKILIYEAVHKVFIQKVRTGGVQVEPYQGNRLAFVAFLEAGGCLLNAGG